jgi:hypothetical protein
MPPFGRAGLADGVLQTKKFKRIDGLSRIQNVHGIQTFAFRPRHENIKAVQALILHGL